VNTFIGAVKPFEEYVKDLYVKRAAKIYGVNFLGELDEGCVTKNRASVCNGLALNVKLDDGPVRIKTRISEKSPLEFRPDTGIMTDTRTGEAYAAELVPREKWVYEKTTTGRLAGSILKDEFNKTVATSVFGCELKNSGQGCKFCSSQKYDGPLFTPEEFSEALEIAGKSGKRLIINSGSLASGQSAYPLLKPYITQASKRDFEWINLELMPPSKGNSAIKKLAREMAGDGVTSLQLNLEFWDEGLRKAFMPYKGSIPKDLYYELMGEWEKVFGKWKTSSVLLSGIENINSTEQGVYKLLENGCVPSIEFFVPLQGTELANMQMSENIESLYEISRLNMDIYERVSKNKDRVEGCLACGGCPTLKPKNR
jgi:hypothetical protein